MAAVDDQRPYWSAVGAQKIFGHPLDPAWLQSVGRSGRVLDFGCGYGRLVGELAAYGFEDLIGVDVSPVLIERARTAEPRARYAVLTEPPQVELAAGSVDLVVLFAVLTCVPAAADQRELVDELRRVLRPGGLLYVSDYALQDDDRNRRRYAAGAEPYGTYGVFDTGDGAVCRHHDPDWFAPLFADFEVEAEREVSVHTMNGHPAVATQLLLRRP